MLTKEHLRYRWEKDKVSPSFLGDTPFWKRHAEAILEASHVCLGKRHAELEKEWSACMAMAGRSKRAVKGLCSVLEKKVQLAPIDEATIENQREFRCKEQVLRLRSSDEIFSYPTRPTSLYSDLLTRRLVESIPKWSVERYLHRYNLALVQGLLLHAEEVYLEFEGMSAPAARAFMRYLKFFGLLVDSKGLPGERCTFHIGGALSELGGSQRYKMRIASMFGALPHFSKWRCRAKLSLEKKVGILDLREDSGLSSHYRPHQDYMPPEWRAFIARLENALKPEWSAQECSWPEVSLEHWHLPDLLYERKDGVRFTVEVFFNHQKNSFLRRLAQEKKIELKSQKNDGDRSLILAEKKCLSGDFSQSDIADVITFNGIPSAMKVCSWINNNGQLGDK